MPTIEVGDLKLYDIEELAKILHVKEATARKILRDGTIKARKLARRWYVTEESLLAYLGEPEGSK